MPKRFTIGPLGEHDDHWLSVWAALTGKSKASLATAVVGIRVKQNKATIQELLEYSAKLRGMSPDDLFNAILANPRFLEENPIAEEDGDEEYSSNQPTGS
ncbi:MAG: hypothetical protein HC769_23720 [Cyanobacteria bacterium CRU_2_1]|nr:hypothetical protein [Cyanobacteria bacterium RU_5_0]NJR61577.1 hypothetical protein [Cyanobacteria bacterium CRU_2_1]